jgi:hypothetical protein
MSQRSSNVIGSGKQGTVYDLKNGCVVKVFDKGSLNQRKRNHDSQTEFLRLNEDTGMVPKLLKSGRSGDLFYLVMERLPERLIPCPDCKRQALTASRQLKPYNHVWTDLMNNTAIDPNTGKVYFYEGGNRTTSYNGTYDTLL